MNEVQKKRNKTKNKIHALIIVTRICKRRYKKKKKKKKMNIRREQQKENNKTEENPFLNNLRFIFVFESSFALFGYLPLNPLFSLRKNLLFFFWHRFRDLFYAFFALSFLSSSFIFVLFFFFIFSYSNGTYLPSMNTYFF